MKQRELTESPKPSRCRCLRIIMGMHTQPERDIFLRRLFEKVNGDVHGVAHMLEIGEELGFTKQKTTLIVQYLEGEGLVEQPDVREGVRLTHPGLKAAVALSDKQEEGDMAALSKSEQPTQSNSVFLVHGRDERVRETVARFLEHLDLRVIILHEQPDRGRTIIEKFEDHSKDAGFAVVLLTGDDRGGLKEEDPSTYPPRARQNVILELGFFLGAFGRDRVCALYEDGVDIPSDYQGVLFTKLDSGWKLKLAHELKAAGLPVDLNRVLS